jgi:hypothetical protein
MSDTRQGADRKLRSPLAKAIFKTLVEAGYVDDEGVATFGTNDGRARVIVELRDDQHPRAKKTAEMVDLLRERGYTIERQYGTVQDCGIVVTTGDTAEK